MFNQITSDRQKNLIEHKNGQMYGDFLPYIPGLLKVIKRNGEGRFHCDREA
jgi:putative DNA primase/helicase